MEVDENDEGASFWLRFNPPQNNRSILSEAEQRAELTRLALQKTPSVKHVGGDQPDAARAEFINSSEDYKRGFVSGQKEAERSFNHELQRVNDAYHTSRAQISDCYDKLVSAQTQQTEALAAKFDTDLTKAESTYFRIGLFAGLAGGALAIMVLYHVAG